MILMLQFTGERYLPWAKEVYEGGLEHLHRYFFASKLVKNKKVLDLASGEGYGAALMAKYATQVTGLDSDPLAVQHAASNYITANLDFITGSITKVPIKEGNVLDAIICFEAIEHIARQDLLLSEVKRLLTKNGLFIVSTPNKLISAEQGNKINPFHLKELYYDEFDQLLKKHFAHVSIIGQRVLSDSQLWPLCTPETGSSTHLYIKHTGKGFEQTDSSQRTPKFFIAICSDEPLPDTPLNSMLTDVEDLRYKSEHNKLKQINKQRAKLESTVQTMQNSSAELNQRANNLRSQNVKQLQELTELRKLPAILNDYRTAITRVRKSRAYAIYQAFRSFRRAVFKR